MSRKIKDFIKIVAALLAVVAVVGLLGSFISQRNGDEDSTESDSIRFEENTEEVVVDHSMCENEHNWSLYTSKHISSSYLNGYGYICGVCNTLILPSADMSFGHIYEVADLSKAHRYSNSTALTSHFNYVNSGDFIYISSKSNGEIITTSFPDIFHQGGYTEVKFMTIGYRVTDSEAVDLTLNLSLNGKDNSFTIASPFTNGWVYVVFDISGLNGFNSFAQGVAFNDIAISFTHSSTLDISFIGFGNTVEIVRNIPGYSGTYYDRGSDFSSIGTPINAE